MDIATNRNLARQVGQVSQSIDVINHQIRSIRGDETIADILDDMADAIQSLADTVDEIIDAMLPTCSELPTPEAKP